MLKKYHKKDVPNLNYAMFHARFGHNDGVSIVMEQISQVMQKEMGIPKNQIFYLVGKSKTRSKQITQNKLFLDNLNGNKLAVKNYDFGFGGAVSEKVEKEINLGKEVIKKFVEKNKIDVIIAHNTCHPVNFVLSVSLSRYYRDMVDQNKKTPKYLLWWHDSHLERDHFKNPANDVMRYLLQGVPGPFVEYIFFINSLQFKIAKNYFLKLASVRKGFYNKISRSKDVIYNTTDVFIDSFKDLKQIGDGTKTFIHNFKIQELLDENNLSLKNTLFCLQHTRFVDRKRIDFALEYCFEFLSRVNKNRKNKKAIYFLVSGMDARDGSKRKVKAIHKKLSKKYPLDKVFLVNAEDVKTSLLFEDYPRIFARLGGFTTYFSEIEGFGNNLLEVLASGLIPVVYTYPVFKKDISNKGFKLIALDKFEIDNKSMDELKEVLKSSRKRKIWVNMNLEVLRKEFAHEIIASKLTRGIIRTRHHK